MPVDVLQFTGLMDTDDSVHNIIKGSHKLAFNGRFRGTGNNLRFENIPGNSLLNNPYLPEGSNETIGGFFDDLKQRIFSFNYNSKGNHAIYVFELSIKRWSIVVQVGVNTDGDILQFNPDYPIYAAKILYGDSVQGDTIYFNNSLREPCEINVERALTGGYGTIKRSFIDVIKAPAIMPPYVCYENDNTVTVNNLRKKLFKFKVRFKYKNNGTSVTSSQSRLPLPVGYLDTNIDKDPTKNCRIAIVFPTGETDVSEIEILACGSGQDNGDGTINPNAFSDFFTIATLNKSELSIPSNDISIFRFYNNQAYINIDVEDSIQLYDYVPLKAIALEILNGNVPIYGGITEDYDQTIINATAGSSFISQQTTQYPFVFQSNQSGDSGFGTGNIHTVLVGKVTVGDVFNIVTTNETISYTASAATTANVITGLSAAAVLEGFTIISSDSENLVMVKSGEVLQRYEAAPVLIPVSDSFIYDRNSNYGWSIVYFDKQGRTIGAQTANGLSVQTITYVESGTVLIPSILFSINNRPPTYAAYYQIVRTKNLSKERKIEWVSDRTFKDANYAYISIESLNVFIAANPSSKFLAFEPIPNDRIRFYKILSGGSGTVYVNNDFEILSNEVNPTINGTVYQGQFVKIALPSTSGTFDFGTEDFFNYFIELYTPAKPVSDGLDKYYEFSERYSIGNYGTSTAFHQGSLQNQTANLSQPAIFRFNEGDYYYRNRTINTGNVISCKLNEGTFGPSTRIGQTLVSQTIPSQNYDVAESVAQGGFVNNFNTPGWTFNVDNGTIVFNITGTINLRAATTTVQNFRIQFYVISGTTSTLYPLGNQTGATAGDNITFTVNTSMTMPSNSRAFLVMNCADNDFVLDLVSGNLVFTEAAKTYTVGVVDPNFSDYFESAVNSNGRAFIVDRNKAQVFNPTLTRWGLNFQPETNINNANRFKFLNFDEFDRSKGKIQRYEVFDRLLVVMQERACGQCGIYSKFVQSNSTNILTTTDEIITKNNIQYYNGTFGVGNQPTGVIRSKSNLYFIDPVRGYQLRLSISGNGLTPISELRKGQFYIQPLFIPYNYDYLKTNGFKSKILGYYDFAEEEAVSVLQAGSFDGKTIKSYTFSYNEKRDMYTSFYDFHPEWILSANDITYSWRQGQMWVHNNKAEWCNFYNEQFYPSILLPFNDKVGVKKTMLGLGYQSNKLWTAENPGDILTTQLNPQTELPQISKLKAFNFSLIEGEYVAAFQRDINSRIDKLDAWYNGDYLKGVATEILLTYKGKDFAYLYLPYLKYAVSNPNF